MFQAPSAARQRVPVRTGGQPRGAAPTWEADGCSRMRRYCVPVPAAL